MTTCSKSCNGQRRKLKQDSKQGGSASGEEDVQSSVEDDSEKGAVSARKEAKKAVKAENRAKRQGEGDATTGQKKCDLCGDSVDLLIRYSAPWPLWHSLLARSIS